MKITCNPVNAIKRKLRGGRLILRSLTEEEKKLAHKVEDEWLDFAFNSNDPINQEEAKKGVDWLYSLAELSKPTVIFVNSPLECQLVANILHSCCGIEQHNYYAESGVIPLMGNVPLWEVLWHRVEYKITDPLRDQVINSVKENDVAEMDRINYRKFSKYDINSTMLWSVSKHATTIGGALRR